MVSGVKKASDKKKPAISYWSKEKCKEGFPSSFFTT